MKTALITVAVVAALGLAGAGVYLMVRRRDEDDGDVVASPATLDQRAGGKPTAHPAATSAFSGAIVGNMDSGDKGDSAPATPSTTGTGRSRVRVGRAQLEPAQSADQLRREQTVSGIEGGLSRA